MRILILALVVLLSPLPGLAQAAESQPAPAALQPGDVLQVQVWREEDLSGEFLIDETGAVTLPLLGEQQVAGVPLREMRDHLLSLYRAELRNSSVVITPLRRVYVLGEVNEPGLYTLDPTLSLAGAVALAGGAGPQGDLNRIRVIRSGEVLVGRATASRALADVDIRSGDEIFVGRRSWFDRNSTFLVSGLLSLTSIVITLLQQK